MSNYRPDRGAVRMMAHVHFQGFQLKWAQFTREKADPPPPPSCQCCNTSGDQRVKQCFFTSIVNNEVSHIKTVLLMHEAEWGPDHLALAELTGAKTGCGIKGGR